MRKLIDNVNGHIFRAKVKAMQKVTDDLESLKNDKGALSLEWVGLIIIILIIIGILIYFFRDTLTNDVLPAIKQQIMDLFNM